MPSPEHLDVMASAKVLTSGSSPADETDSLRRADGLSVRRLGWSIQLRSVEILAHDLRPKDWQDERARFYGFAQNHILRADKILDHFDHFPRLLSLAVSVGDWDHAKELIETSLKSLQELQGSLAGTELKVNGIAHRDASLIEVMWKMLLSSTIELARSAVLCALPWSERTGQPLALGERAQRLLEIVGLSIHDAERKALLLRHSDLAKVPYKEHLRLHASTSREAILGERKLQAQYPFLRDLREFLRTTMHTKNGAPQRVHERCRRPALVKRHSLLPFIAPTRPYTAQEIALYSTERCVFGTASEPPADAWARYVRAVRGSWVRTELLHRQDSEEGEDSVHVSLNPSERQIFAEIGRPNTKQEVRLGISSLLTTEESYFGSASGVPDLSPARYARIRRLVNQAVQAHPKPTHLLLPELSLPQRWIQTVSGLLLQSKISLVAGLDYERQGKSRISSSALLVLSDDRLGFPSSVELRQPKGAPAPNEERALLQQFGLRWTSGLAGDRKPVYVHAGFHFGVLVCSELQNISLRRNFQGSVDCVMVLAWNQDLETFSSLVESASLDVHAHVALVNNRAFGDSRVRTPAKNSFDRDACRIRGGLNEHIVVQGIEIGQLRAFQSRSRRWSCTDDRYKPVPEGFRIARSRRTIPR